VKEDAGQRPGIGCSAVVLERPFFERPAPTVARQLLGKFLVRRRGDVLDARMITETEAYIGPHDLACHASRGRTQRTEPMFGPGGTLYVYFIYGMYWMLNVVTCEEGYPAAVLIRGVEGLSGPGRLTKALEITKEQNGRPAWPETGLWFEDRGRTLRSGSVKRTPRIGVDYAREWSQKEYRYLLNSETKRAR
jgi:DNA-3-methyladenine glycosylase